MHSVYNVLCIINHFSNTLHTLKIVPSILHIKPLGVTHICTQGSKIYWCIIYLLLVVEFVEVGHLVSPHLGASGPVQTVVVQSRSPLAVLRPPQHLLYQVQRQQTLREYQNFLFQFPRLFQQLQQKLNLPADSCTRLAVGGQKVVVPLRRGRGTMGGGFVVGRGDDVATISLLGGWFCGASDSFGRGRGIWVWFEADGWECDVVFITTTQHCGRCWYVLVGFW
jgi:hypothetical protein